MKEKYKEKGDNFKYLLMDVKAMDFPETSFDAVVDKATLDSVLVFLNLHSADKIRQLTQIKWSPKYTESLAKMASILWYHTDSLNSDWLISKSQSMSGTWKYSK